MNISEQVSVDTPSTPQDQAQYFRTLLGTIGTMRTFAAGSVVFMQGDSAADLMYLLEGAVTKSVMSRDGKEGVVGLLGPGDFLGEECLTGQAQRMATVASLSAGRLLVIDKRHMLRLLDEQRELAHWFLSRTLARLNRIEDDLADQLFNPSEKRLARTLLLLARYGSRERGPRVLPNLSQTMLAEMVGTTRSRVNFFMNKFKKLGFIDYNDKTLTITPALMHVVVDEGHASQLETASEYAS
jgi:CRP/FNR family transcriptional regulator, cyclic AMP receptor protein